MQRSSRASGAGRASWQCHLPCQRRPPDYHHSARADAAAPLEAFSYSVSHDLRALRSIDGFSQALLEDVGDRLDPKALNDLMRVRSAAQRMGELIDDLLELSRLGRAELHEAHMDLAELARTVAEGLVRRHAELQCQMIWRPFLRHRRLEHAPLIPRADRALTAPVRGEANTLIFF